MNSRWCLKTLWPWALLVVVHSFSAFQGYQSLQSGSFRGLTLETSPREWAQAIIPGDPGYYLTVGLNVAQGKGLVIQKDLRSDDPQEYEPFAFWAPGTPWVLGQALKLFGQNSMKPLFGLTVFFHLLAGVLTLLTVRLFTKNVWISGITALLTLVNPPPWGFFYGPFLTSSEAVISLPFAAFFYFLTCGFLELWDLRSPPRKHLIPFAIAGVMLACASLIRDSNSQFAPFLLLAIPVIGWRRGHAAFKRALGAALMLFATCQMTLAPVKFWNLGRVGHAVLSTSSATLWRNGIWEKFNLVPWHYTSGIGFGTYLDPQARERVEQAFDQGHGSAALSLEALVKAIAKHPLKALEFKVSRWPVLWLGTLQWPQSEWTLLSVSCLLLYAGLFYYLFLCWRRRIFPIETCYLYAVFLFLASTLIHFEFRYSYPVWMTLIWTPALIFSLYEQKQAPFPQSENTL